MRMRASLPRRILPIWSCGTKARNSIRSRSATTATVRPGVANSPTSIAFVRIVPPIGARIVVFSSRISSCAMRWVAASCRASSCRSSASREPILPRASSNASSAWSTRRSDEAPWVRSVRARSSSVVAVCRWWRQVRSCGGIACLAWSSAIACARASASCVSNSAGSSVTNTSPRSTRFPSTSSLLITRP